MAVVLIAGSALLGAIAGALWGAAHPDLFFGREFNAFIDGTYGFSLGLVAGIVLWIASLRVRLRRRKP